MNNLKTQGFYSINTAKTNNTPDNCSNFGACLVIQMGGTSSSYINQIWIDMNNTNPKLYARCYTNTWHNWIKLSSN